MPLRNEVIGKVYWALMPPVKRGTYGTSLPLTPGPSDVRVDLVLGQGGTRNPRRPP